MQDFYVFVVRYKVQRKESITMYRAVRHDGTEMKILPTETFEELKDSLTGGVPFLNKAPASLGANVMEDVKRFVTQSVYKDFGLVAFDLLIAKTDVTPQPLWMPALASLCIGESPYVFDGIGKMAAALIRVEKAVEMPLAIEGLDIVKIFEDMYAAYILKPMTETELREHARKLKGQIHKIYNLEAC